MLEIGRVLTAAGSVAATTGVVIFAMGAAFVEPRDYEMNIGIFLMIAGTVATIVGIVLYRQYSTDD
ncbi:MAG: hypothetical protein WKF81_14975 [Thermomicrobiales bacterium]